MVQRTKTDELLKARQEAAEATDPERAQLLRLVRAFKASWFDLAQALSAVKREGAWQRWGHRSFEDYTRRELALSPSTVEKLTGSYAFLASRAPEVARRVRRPVGQGEPEATPGAMEDRWPDAADPDESAAAMGGVPAAVIPSYQAVDFWRRAEESGAADAATLDALGSAVLSGATPARLSRRFGAAAFPVSERDRRARTRAAALAAARRLADAVVDCEDVPRPLVRELEAALGRLIQILDRPSTKA